MEIDPIWRTQFQGAKPKERKRDMKTGLSIYLSISENSKNTNRDGTNDREFRFDSFPAREIWITHKPGRFYFSTTPREAWKHHTPGQGGMSMGTRFPDLPVTHKKLWDLYWDEAEQAYYIELPAAVCSKCGQDIKIKEDA